MPFFGPNELLFRQVPNTHIEEGEVNFLAIRANTKFSGNPAACTSVVRSAYTESFRDAIHPNCANGKDLSETHSVLHVRVADLPKGLRILPLQQGDALSWDMYPHHEPLPLCYAHSTICCCNQDAPDACVTPPSSVRDEFRRWFAANLVPSEDTPNETIPLPVADVPTHGLPASPGKLRALCIRVSRFYKSFLEKLGITD
jgi:hypothetical protein